MFNSKYKLKSRIGNGAFGMIYEGECLNTENENVAIKIEMKN